MTQTDKERRQKIAEATARCAQRLRRLTPAIRDLKRATTYAIKRDAKEARAAIAADYRAQSGAKIAHVKADLLADCGADKPKIERHHRASLYDLLRELEEAADAAQKAKTDKRTARKRSGRYERAESDELVEADLDKELVPAWRVVKADIWAPDPDVRLQEFLEWAHDHADVVKEHFDDAFGAAGEIVLLEDERYSELLRIDEDDVLSEREKQTRREEVLLYFNEEIATRKSESLDLQRAKTARFTASKIKAPKAAKRKARK